MVDFIKILVKIIKLFVFADKVTGGAVTDFIEKLTWGLAAFMVVVSIACAYVLPSSQAGGSVIMEQAVKESATNPLNAPAGFVAPSTDAAPAEAPVAE